MLMKAILETLRKKWIAYLLEIIVITISILGAFALESWRENLEKVRIEKNFTERLAMDLLLDKENLIRIISVQEQKSEQINILIDQIDLKIPSNKKKLDSLFTSVYGINPTFYPTVGTYNSAIAAGTMADFQNSNNLSTIITLYDTYYSRLQYNGINLDNKWFAMSEKYKLERRTKSLKPMSDPEIVELQNDLYWHISAVDFYIVRCKETLKKIDEILNL